MFTMRICCTRTDAMTLDHCLDYSTAKAFTCFSILRGSNIYGIIIIDAKLRKWSTEAQVVDQRSCI